MSTIITEMNLLIKRNQFFIEGLSKNTYTMYSDRLAVHRVQTMDDNYSKNLYIRT